MTRRKIASLAVVGAIAASAFALPASAGTAWNVSVGVPGFAVSTGQGYYGHGYVTGAVGVPAYVGPTYVAPAYYRPYYRPYHRHYYYRPYAPVVVAPAPAYVAPPVAVYPSASATFHIH